ncbi:serine/threonine protein kinase [Amycolatopsis sp. CA-230715]|uniref:serine/threonine protein kinase n=1 Tax=Amycolatopsis sp. CA-230715 TaxID=2745196 RepID=UPI001C031941|nr:serine/threonine-protein kinase [Amycolatopsis sp. CA-230715]QWF80827.1 Serine/threonine-protein kinase PknD [Amycolatopsis sp. CA-230715]
MKPLNPDEAHLVGRYQPVALLGEGGMGRVYLGVAPNGRLVAIKQVHPSFAHDDGFRSRFIREVKTSRMVSGAYTAAVMDADPDAQIPWLASVYVPGPSLKETVDAIGPLPTESIHYLATGLATALEEIHRVGLIHRDLKPSNVLLTDDGPRVIDFGIARAAEDITDITHTGSVIGSPGFMSPEQAEGKALTPASDVFSLGALLVMAATGSSPFAGDSTPQTLYNVVHNQPNLTTLTPHLQQLVRPCFTKNPAYRPTPRQILDHLGTATPTTAPWPPSVHWEIQRCKDDAETALGSPRAPAPVEPKNRKKTVLCATLSGVVVIAGITTFIARSRQPDAPKPSIPASAASVEPLTTTNMLSVDPCGVLDGKPIGELGLLSSVRRSQHQFSDCNFVDSSFKNGVAIDISTLSPNPGDPVEIEGLQAKIQKTGISCTVSARYPTTDGMYLEASLIGDTKDRCGTVRDALVETIRTVRTNPPRYPSDPGSIATTNPCTVVPINSINQIIGHSEPRSNRDEHSCSYAGERELDVEFRIGPPATSSNEETTISGRKVAIIRTDSGAHYQNCEARWEQQSRGDDYPEQVSISMSNPIAPHAGMAPFSLDTACQKVKDFAAAMIPRLPKP